MFLHRRPPPTGPRRRPPWATPRTHVPCAGRRTRPPRRRYVKLYYLCDGDKPDYYCRWNCIHQLPCVICSFFVIHHFLDIIKKSPGPSRDEASGLNACADSVASMCHVRVHRPVVRPKREMRRAPRLLVVVPRSPRCVPIPLEKRCLVGLWRSLRLLSPSFDCRQNN